jgi:hypothetical protein
MKAVLVMFGSMWLACAAYAHAASALCVASTLDGTLRLSATGKCKAGEIQLGSFDGATLQLSGINVQIVSGAGATDAAVNGRGNLIVGYDANTAGHGRTGSHNLVVGDEHTYTSFGGLVAGFQNSVTGKWASAIGGEENTASGDNSCVTAGFSNVAGGAGSSVTGGQRNEASSTASVVGGGLSNTVSGSNSVVSGGEGNTASAGFIHPSTVSGGNGNVASGEGSSVSGGVANVASGTWASISGGANLTQPVQSGWAAGSDTGNAIVGDFESP